MLEFRNINNSQSDIEQRKSKIKQDIQLLIENGYYAEAQSSIESYLEVEPDDFEIYSIHAVLLIYQGKLDAAERVLNQGLLYNEYDPDLLFNKSWLMEQKGDIALAKYYYGRALTYCRDTEIKNQLKEKLSIPVTTNEQPYVLIGSPVHQDYEILKKFLKSLSRLNYDGLKVGYLFIDDNTDESSSNLLKDFCQRYPNANVISHKSGDTYLRDDTHHWNRNLVDKVARFKNIIIRQAIDDHCDYLFLVDSDTLLHPQTLQQLISDQKDVVANILWTRWQEGLPEMPNAWLEDNYSFYKTRPQQMTKADVINETVSFFAKLRNPGVYEVGLVGGCTLLSRDAMLAGASFSRLHNFSNWGEDRHFCFRLVALGFKIYIDTHYPALHLYRPSDLQKAEQFFLTGQYSKPKKICLVTNNFSGSNTLALYKLASKEFIEQYDIVLTTQQDFLNYLLEIYNSDVVIITEGNYGLTAKKMHSEQIVIDLWHGFPLKAMGYADKEEIFKDQILNQWKNVDYVASYSQLFNEVMNQCINISSEKYFISGAPRNDLLFYASGKKNLENILQLSLETEKLAVFMPTYRFTPRGDRTEGAKNLDNIFGFEQFDVESFNHFLKTNKIHFIVKLHPAEEARFQNMFYGASNLHLITQNQLMEHSLDFYEILNAFDLLITDYSSVYFDFLLLDRPEIFTPVDIEAYEKSRGFLLKPYEDWVPGPIVLDQENLEKEIIGQLNNDTYSSQRETIRNRIHYYQDRNSALRIFQFLDNLLTR